MKYLFAFLMILNTYASEFRYMNSTQEDQLIYPLYISNYNNKNIKIIKDECAFLQLKPSQSCVVKYSVGQKTSIKVYNLLNEDFVFKEEVGKTNKFKKDKQNMIEVELGKKTYIKVGLGNILKLSIKSDTVLKNFTKDTKKCNNCYFKFLAYEKEKIEEISINGKKYYISFILRKPEVNNNLEYENDKLITSYRRGLPIKETVHDSLYSITEYKETQIKENKYKYSMLINLYSSKKKRFQKIFYKKFPFGKEILKVKEGDVEIVDLSLRNDFLKIENYGTIIFKSKYNLAILGVKDIDNYGEIKLKHEEDVINVEKINLFLGGEDFEIKEILKKPDDKIHLYLYSKEKIFFDTSKWKIIEGTYND